jgi:hypothetical protein
VVFEQDRASVDPSEPDEGPRVLEVGTKYPQGGVFTAVVNDPSSITIFARNRYHSNSSDGERLTPYYVYGIRRGVKED